MTLSIDPRRVRADQSLRDIGIQVAATLIDMFDGMSADEPIFEQYSFVDDDCCRTETNCTLAKREGNDAISEEDTAR